jgi:O-antigen/teichoic acid export membrane protein
MMALKHPLRRLESVAGGSLSLVAGRFLGLLFGLVSAMFVSRYLGVSDYGRMGSIVAFWSIFGLASEMGVSSVVAAEMAKPGTNGGSLWLAGVLVQTGFSVAACAVGFVLGTFLFAGQPEMRVGLVVGSLLVFSSMPAVNSIHQLRLKMRLPAALGVAQSALVALLSVLGVVLKQPWYYFVFVSAVSGILAVLANFLFAWRESEGDRAAYLQSTLRIVRASALVGLAGVFATICFKLDTVLVFRIAGAAQAGLYSAAYRLYELVLIVPTAVMVSAIPVAARLMHGDPDPYRRYSGGILTVLLLLGFAASLLVTAFSRLGLTIVFGNKFDGATLLLVLLMPGAMARYLSIWMGTLLIASGRRGRFFWIAAVSACVAVILDLVLIRVLAARGAALVTTGVEICVVAAAWFALDRSKRPGLPRPPAVVLLGGAALWCAAASVGIWVSASLYWFALALVPVIAAVLLARAAIIRLNALQAVR